MSAPVIEEARKGPHDEPHEKPIRIYKHSSILYWWPIWCAGFLFALLSYLDGGYMAWVPPGTQARRDWQVKVGPGQTEPREGLLLPAAEGRKTRHLLPARPAAAGDPLPEPQQPQVRMARGKYLGFAFAVLLGLVLLHGSIVMRGPVSFAGVLVGAIVLLIIPLVDAYFPGVRLWSWIRYGVYELPSVYISMHGYLFIATLFFLIWLGIVWFYDRRTYIEVAPGQFRVRQEIGQEDVIYDVTLMTFEKRRDDFFHHKLLGLGFLRHLGLGFLTTGTGDLAFRPGGTKAQIVYWPNVWNVQRVLARLEDMMAEREVV